MRVEFKLLCRRRIGKARFCQACFSQNYYLFSEVSKNFFQSKKNGIQKYCHDLKCLILQGENSLKVKITKVVDNAVNMLYNNPKSSNQFLWNKSKYGEVQYRRQGIEWKKQLAVKKFLLRAQQTEKKI